MMQTLSWPKSQQVLAWRMGRIAKRNKAVLIHCHFLWNAALAIAAGSFGGVPVICTGHGTDVNRATVDEHYRLHLQQVVFPRINYIIAVSAFIARRLKEIGCPQDKIQVMYLGAPLPQKYSLPNRKSDTIQVVCVASLAPVKGYLDLLEGFRLALRAVPILRLTLIGDGPERHTIERFIKEWGLENSVVLTGWLPPEGVQKALLNSDLYAQASYRYKDPGGQRVSEEGLPISMVEAAGHGLPIIGTDSGGISEICCHNINGLLVPERDTESIAKALIELACSDELRAKMGRESRNIAEADFDTDKQMGKLEAFYDRAAKPNCRRYFVA
jgi:colanic acid/amylovoran biosynthesis glycosyltransferase